VGNFDERLIEALHVAERLVRSPEALANILEATGPLTLERAGAFLDEPSAGASRVSLRRAREHGTVARARM